MLGSRSVVILINDMTPRMSASTTQMKMVIGLLTLRRESIGQSPFWESRAADRAAVFSPTDRSVGRFLLLFYRRSGELQEPKY